MSKGRALHVSAVADHCRMSDDVMTLLQEKPIERHSEDELKALLSVVSSGGKLEDISPQTAYSLNFDFSDAISDLPIAALGD